jgi:hypothetical protein
VSQPPRPSPILTLFYAGRAAVKAAVDGRCIHCGDPVPIVQNRDTGKTGKPLVCKRCLGDAVDKGIDMAEGAAKEGVSALFRSLLKPRQR